MPRESEVGFRPRRSKPTLTEVFRVAQRAAELKLRVAVPATVVAYDPATNRVQATVDFLSVRYTEDGEAPNPEPLLISAPVAFPSSLVGYLTFPLTAGSPGLLVVSDRSLELWNQLGTPAPPPLPGAHKLGDSVFFPGLRPTSKPITPPPDQTATVLEGPLVKLGPAAVQGVARLLDGVSPSVALTTWATLVETAINALAPGTFTPANNFAATVAPDFGFVSEASQKVSCE